MRALDAFISIRFSSELVSIFGTVMLATKPRRMFCFLFHDFFSPESNIVGGAMKKSECQRVYALAPMLEIAFCLPYFGENKWVTALHRLKCFFLFFSFF